MKVLMMTIQKFEIRRRTEKGGERGDTSNTFAHPQEGEKYIVPFAEQTAYLLATCVTLLRLSDGGTSFVPSLPLSLSLSLDEILMDASVHFAIDGTPVWGSEQFQATIWPTQAVALLRANVLSSDGAARQLFTSYMVAASIIIQA